MNPLSQQDQSTSEYDVAVIVPMYNAADTISAALDSIVATNYKRLQVVIVDDGSTDGSVEIVNEYNRSHGSLAITLAQHPRGENHGASASRNLGARLSSGRYLAFLDADDRYLPNRFEESIQILERRPEVSAVFGRFQFEIVGDQSNEEFRDVSDDVLSSQKSQIDLIIDDDELFRAYLRGISGVHTSSITIRRDCFFKLGGFARLRYAEDHMLWTKLIGSHKVARIGGEAISIYRIHPQSLCSSGISTFEFVSAPVVAQAAALRWLKLHNVLENNRRTLEDMTRGKLYYLGSKMLSKPPGWRWRTIALACSCAVIMPRLLKERTFYGLLIHLVMGTTKTEHSSVHD